MAKRLNCTISMGQFQGEYAVQGRLFDNSIFSLFAEKADLVFESNEPSENKCVSGWIRVESLQVDKGLLLVALPRPTLENGQAITVKAEDIKEECG